MQSEAGPGQRVQMPNSQERCNRKYHSTSAASESKESRFCRITPRRHKVPVRVQRQLWRSKAKGTEGQRCAAVFHHGFGGGDKTIEGFPWSQKMQTGSRKGNRRRKQTRTDEGCTSYRNLNPKYPWSKDVTSNTTQR